MKKLLLYSIIFLTGLSCKESYNLPFTAPAAGYLVVEGFINGQGPTTLKLTRTVALVDTISIKNEPGAQVRVEGDDNSTQQLNYQGNGLYTAAQLSLNNNVQYRLHINTADGKEYLSEFITVKLTPPIDSISWERNDGVEIFVNTHDAQNNTRYYQWEYEETWEFRSAHYSELKYIRDAFNEPYGVTERLPAESAKMYTCWKSQSSTSLLIGSSAKLSKDSIHLPVMHIPHGSWKISVLYSILIRQYALTKEHYEFLQRMKKNTEQVGSIFDAQPSELKGNISCISHPDEIVIGFVGIANPQEKRIFIKRSEVPQWNYFEICPLTVVVNHPDSIAEYAHAIPTIVAETTPLGTIASFNVADAICVDCTLRGTNVKPPFWP